MRSTNSPIPTGTERASTFMQEVSRRNKSELQFYDSSTVKVENMTRGVRFHARRNSSGSAPSIPPGPFGVYKINSKAAQKTLAIQVREGMISMRGRSIISLETRGLFSGNFEQLVFFFGTYDNTLGWNDPPNANSYTWMTLTTAPQDTDVLYDYGDPGQIILNPDDWGGQMTVVLWLKIQPDGLGVELHLSNITNTLFPPPSPQIIPLAIVYAIGSQPFGPSYAVFVEKIFGGGAGISRFSPMIGRSNDGVNIVSTQPTGPTYYAGDFDDDNMAFGWVIWPGDIVRVTLPYGEGNYKNTGVANVPTIGNVAVQSNVDYAFFQCINPNQIVITDSPSSGDPFNPVSDPTTWILVSEIYSQAL